MSESTLAGRGSTGAEGRLTGLDKTIRRFGFLGLGVVEIGVISEALKKFEEFFLVEVFLRINAGILRGSISMESGEKHGPSDVGT